MPSITNCRKVASYHAIRVSIAALILCSLSTTAQGEAQPPPAWERGAQLEPMAYAVDTIDTGVTIFTDRDFVFHEPPALLRGLPFLRLSIVNPRPIKITKGGTLTIITPAPDTSNPICSNAKELEELGFNWVKSPERFQLFGNAAMDQCRIYQKEVVPGDLMQFKKWVVVAGFNPQNLPIFKPNQRLVNVIEKLAANPVGSDERFYAHDIQASWPEYVVFIPKQPRDRKQHDPAKPGDTYNDHFQVIEHSGILYAFWTQATVEADIDQHIAFSKSLDKGVSWSEPQILAGSPNKKNPALRASWQQPMISKSGRIYCLWNQQTTNRRPHYGLMFGAYSDDQGETWTSPKMVVMNRSIIDDPDPFVPPAWCNWQRPLRLGANERYLVGVSRHGLLPGSERRGCYIEFLQFDNIDDNPKVEDIKLSWFSGDENLLRVSHEKFGDAAEEVGLVKLPDGRLFGIMRTSAGHPFWTQSRDNGVTWTQPKPLLDRDGGKPWMHPRSPCPIYDWKGCEAGSGTYFALVHNTFDYEAPREYQNRGPLYLIAGRFNPRAEQPVEFAPPKLLAPRESANSFYTSYTIVDGKGILWFPDKKFYLLGREIGEEWFK